MCKGILIRDINKEDYKGLILLLEDLGYPSTLEQVQKRMKRINDDNTYKTLVAIKDEKLVGLMGLKKLYVYESDEFYANIVVLVVLKQYQGFGIGTKLVKKAEMWAKKEKANCLVLTSGINRTGAHTFYKNRGFEINGYRFKKSL